MRKIKIGILGYSDIAKKAIIPAILQSLHFELTFIASRNKEKQIAAMKEYGIKVGTYEQLLESDVEAVYVSTPVGLHYEFGKKVLAAGKHLLLEKTFTHSFESSLDLVQIAHNKKLVVMEALMYQYHPLLQKVQTIINKGEIGEIKQIETYFGYPKLKENDIRFNKELGGGAILDVLVYPLSLVLNILGNHYEQFHVLHQFNHKYAIDEGGSVLLEYKNSSAYIKFGFGLAYRNEYRIWGTEGILSVKRGFSRPADSTTPIVLEKNMLDTIVDVPKSDHFSDMLDMFYKKIHSNNFDIDLDLLKRMEIIDLIYKHTYQ